MPVDPKLLLEMYDRPRLSLENEEFIIKKIRDNIKLNHWDDVNNYYFWCCLLYFLISVVFLKEKPKDGKDLLHKIQTQALRFDLWADHPSEYLYDKNPFMSSSAVDFSMDYTPYFYFHILPEDPDRKRIEDIFDEEIFIKNKEYYV